ncbi:unnamed protein product [Lasius platythorax]|uniref:Uncharacterized protein n=1 Tax=Lasius platythorax TaxID=488582 RepID=A0AAV2MX99_9HYME
MKRGIYKRYLENDEVPIPETTRRRRLMQETMERGISSDDDDNACGFNTESADDNDTSAGQSSNISLNDICLLKSEDSNNGEWDDSDIDSAVSDIINNNDNNVGAEQHIINNVIESNKTENVDESSEINSNCTEYNEDEIGQFEDAPEDPDVEYKSKYLFCKDFETPVPVRKIYYCQDCEINILEFEDNAAIARCKDCGNEYNKNNLKITGHYFMYLPLTEQLTNMLNNIDISQHLKQQYDEKSDVISMWPIQVSINELPYRLRRQNMILCGLWYGSKKPVIEIFLKPFVRELICLHNDEIILDSVARPLLQNMKQFNSHFGCSFCLNKGQRVSIGAGYTRVYCGDYMHCVLLGVVRTFADAWFNSSYSDKPWYMGKFLLELDRKLTKIKPPSEISRTPRSINDRKLWKASE